MSTSLLYHGFGIKGYHYLRVKYIEGKVVYTVGLKAAGFAMCGMRVSQGHPAGGGGAALQDSTDWEQAGIYNPGDTAG